MGFKINTAIGWGMPMEDFHSMCRIPGLPDPKDESWYETLKAALADTVDMRMPRWPLPVTGPDSTCMDLMTFVGYDHWSDVILYPSIGEARRWHRRNDDIDYALQWGPRGPDDHETPEDRVQYLSTGFHPYGDLRMNPDGTEATRPADEDVWDWELSTDLLPGVPRSLRYWTTASGLLDLDGVARLRPLRAIWWT